MVLGCQDAPLAEGIMGYANEQAALQHSLKVHFWHIWQGTMKDKDEAVKANEQAGINALADVDGEAHHMNMTGQDQSSSNMASNMGSEGGSASGGEDNDNEEDANDDNDDGNRGDSDKEEMLQDVGNNFIDEEGALELPRSSGEDEDGSEDGNDGEEEQSSGYDSQLEAAAWDESLTRVDDEDWEIAERGRFSF